MTLNIDAGILAGGLSQRMAGKNKGLIPYHSKPMVQWVKEALQLHTNKILISSNQDNQLYQKFGDAVVPDLCDGYKGPLSGFYSLLSNTTADYLLSSSCDTPLLGEDYAVTMIEALNNDLKIAGQGKLLYCAQVNERIQPLHLLISPRLRESLHQSIKSDRLKVMDWIQEQPVSFVSFSDANMFRNFNHPEDLELDS